MHGATRLSSPVQSGLVSNLEGGGALLTTQAWDIGLALIRPSQELLVSYRPLARLGLTRQKRAVAPRAGRRIAWKLYATRHNSPEAWTNAQLL